MDSGVGLYFGEGERESWRKSSGCENVSGMRNDVAVREAPQAPDTSGLTQVPIFCVGDSRNGVPFLVRLVDSPGQKLFSSWSGCRERSRYAGKG